MTCAFDGCTSDVFARSWCSRHYHRWYRHGDPAYRRDERRDPGETKAFFSANVNRETDECIVAPWRAPHAYLDWKQDGVRHWAHIEACVMVHGAQPFPGAVVRHYVCGHAACFNPRHVKWGSAWENTQDMVVHGVRVSSDRNSRTKALVDAVGGLFADGPPSDPALQPVWRAYIAFVGA